MNGEPGRIVKHRLQRGKEGARALPGLDRAFLGDPADRAPAGPIDNIKRGRMPAHPETIALGALHETHIRLVGAETRQGKRLPPAVRHDENRPGRAAGRGGRVEGVGEQGFEFAVREVNRDRQRADFDNAACREGPVRRRADEIRSGGFGNGAPPLRLNHISRATRPELGRRANRQATPRGSGRPGEGPADHRISASTGARMQLRTRGPASRDGPPPPRGPRS